MARAASSFASQSFTPCSTASPSRTQRSVRRHEFAYRFLNISTLISNLRRLSSSAWIRASRSRSVISCLEPSGADEGLPTQAQRGGAHLSHPVGICVAIATVEPAEPGGVDDVPRLEVQGLSQQSPRV